MDKYIIALFTKHLNNQCSAQESAEVFELIKKGGHLPEWDFVISEEANAMLVNGSEAHMSEEEVAALNNRIQHTVRTDLNKVIKLPSRNLQWRKMAVAAILLVLSIVSYQYFSKKAPQQETLGFSHDIMPGGNKAILTLANGRKINLSDAKNGELAQQAGIKVLKLADGQIVYTVEKGQGTEVVMNSIATPNGGQYQLILPDGSKVLLNAASTLIYPSSFAGSKARRVELKGEAYFEIAKDKAHPFLIKTAQQEVKVLGTHFNINSYADEPSVKTTLVEGSVLVKTPKSAAVLKPGEQAIVNFEGIKTAAANTELELAWKNGFFMFESESITSVMRKISRWYDVEVVFKGEIPTDKFGGTVSRFSNVSKVLKKLEYTNKVHFLIEERRIIVTK